MQINVYVSVTYAVSPDPIAVEAVGHAMAEMDQRDRAAADVGGIEHRKVAAVGLVAPDHGQQPAAALGGLGAPRHEDRLGQTVAVGQQVGGTAGAGAVDMGEEGESAEERAVRI